MLNSPTYLLQYLFHAPASHRLSVMLDGAIVKDFVSEFAVEGNVLLRIGEENELTAAPLPYVLFPICDELRADARPLDGRVHREGARVPDAGAGLLVFMAGNQLEKYS